MATEKKDQIKDQEDEKGAGKIDPKWLDGVRFRYSEHQDVMENGRKSRKYTAMERPAKPADVLAIRDYGDAVVLVLADGKKYRVKR